MPENLKFLAETLNAEFVREKVAHAVARLSGEPQWKLARRVEQDLPKCQDLIRERTKELPQLLADPIPEGWSI